MLPLSRLLKYGAMKVPAIQKMDTTTTSTVMLYDNGNLYGYGLNSSGVLGLGHSNVVTEITLLSTDVTDVWCAQSDILIQKGDKFYYSGAGQIIGSSNVTVNTFTDCTASFGSLKVSDIKKIQLSLGMAVLSTSGNLYCCGFNNGFYGNGTFNRISTLSTVLATGVLDIKTNKNGTMWIVKNDGRMYTSGKNDFYQSGAGTNATISTFTQAGTFTSLTNLDKLYVSDTSTYYDSGTGILASGNKLGNGNNATTAHTFRGVVGYDYTLYAGKMYGNSYSAAAPFILGSSVAGGVATSLNFCGTNTYGAYGTGNTTAATTFQPMSSLSELIDFSKLQHVASSAFGTSIIADGKLYVSGDSQYGSIPGQSTGVVLSFINKPLPE